MSSTTGRGILRASMVVMLAHIIFKFSSFIQNFVIARVNDGPVTLELYTFGFEIVLYTIYLVGEEGLGPAFLPVFMEEKDQGREDSAWSFANTLLTVQVVLIALVTGAMMLFPEVVVSYATDWASQPASAEKVARAPFVVRWMAPGLFGLSVGSTTYLLLNGYKRFFLAALGDASVKVGIIVMALSGYFVAGNMLFWFCLGVVSGSLAKLATHLVGLRREVRNFRPRLDLKSPAFRKFLLLVAPLIVGILLAKVRDWYNEAYVLSALPGTLISPTRFGKKIFQTFGWLVPYSASIAMYPFFCELVDRDNRAELARIVTLGCHIIMVLCVPLTAILVALSMPVVRQIYENPNFDLLMCSQAALANAAFTLVLPFYALEYVFMQAFFSNRRMWTPILLGMAFSMLSMVFCYLGAIHFNTELAELLTYLELSTGSAASAAAIVAVGLAFTISRAGKVLSLAVLMKRFLPTLDGRHAFSFGGRMLLSGMLSGIATYGARLLYEGWVDTSGTGSFRANITVLPPLMIFAGLAGGAVYLLSLRVMCPAEWRQTITWTGARIKDFRDKRR